MLLTKSRLVTDDKRVSNLIAFDIIAKRYGWTFDYIGSLPTQTINNIKAIVDGERRHANFVDTKTRRRQGKGRR